MKNFSDIQALLDRYWEGETTLEEERALKAYFASGDVDERLRAVAPLFQALREEQAIKAPHLSDDFKSSDEYARPKTKVMPPKPVHFSWQKLAAAASVALLLTAGLWWWAQREKPVSEQVVQQSPAQQEQISAPENPILEENKTATTEEKQAPVFTQKTPPKHKKPAALDPEEEQAMEEIKAALALISSKMKKGRQEAAKGAIHLENVDKVFKKNAEG